jgi:hypothetical protein
MMGIIRSLAISKAAQLDQCVFFEAQMRMCDLSTSSSKLPPELLSKIPDASGPDHGPPDGATQW